MTQIPDKDRLKIIFMGTPDFSIPPLMALHKSRHEVVLVVSQPDRPKGRGRKLAPSPVKKRAQKLGYDIFQPKSFKSIEVAQYLAQFKADLMVVVAFGAILPPQVLDICPMGAINVHASILPRHRGAAPIHYAILKGDRETGVTTMQLDAGMDTGDMLLSAKTPIAPDETASTLHDRLAEMGAELLMETIEGLLKNEITPVPQDESLATYASLLTKQSGEIDWERTSKELHCFIRAMDPWPGAYTFCGDKRIKVFKARPIPFPTEEPPGTILHGFAHELLVATGDGALSILELQEASGKRLAVKDYLCGCCMAPGSRLGSVCG